MNLRQSLVIAGERKRGALRGYAENLRYLSIIYILSRGSALLSTTLCGAAKMAWGFSQNGFEYMDVPGISS